MSGEEVVRRLVVSLGFKTDEASKKRVLDESQALKNSVKKALGAIGITVSLAGVIKFGRDAVQAASDVEQMEQKFNVVFQGISEEVDAWAENLANAIGRSKNSIKTYLADNQNLLVGFGMAREEAARLSEQMVKSAIDLASFSNINEDEAVDAMSKALMGETESAKRLGAVLNENTIATAMETMGLKGKFDALDEATKMQVRYTAIMNQSKDSIGDAERSMGSYESQSRQLNAQLKEIKENVGRFILPYANKLVGVLSKGSAKLKELTEKLGDVNEEGTTANKIYMDFEGCLKIVGGVIEGLVDIGKKAVDFIGGSENAVKLLTAAIAGLLAYKIGQKAKGFVGTLKGMLKVISAIGVKGLAIIGIAVALFLVIQDFIGFLQGKNSLFGELLEKAGIDVEAAREKFLSFGEDIQEIFGFIGDILTAWKVHLQGIWAECGDEVTGFAEWLLGAIGTTLSAIASLIGPAVSFILNTIKGLFALLSGDTDAAMAAFQEAYGDFGEFSESFFTGLLNILDSLFGGLPSKALTWGKDMLQGFIDGVTSKITSLKEKVTGVGKTIKEFLHFSKPDKGPLHDADTWTPDMMDLFISGIQSRKGKLKEMIGGVAGMMKDAALYANESGIGTLAGNVNISGKTAGNISNSRNIVQNLSFNNTFNGGTPESQRQASGQMNKNARDASSYLAHALALGR